MKHSPDEIHRAEVLRARALRSLARSCAACVAEARARLGIRTPAAGAYAKGLRGNPALHVCAAPPREVPRG